MAALEDRSLVGAVSAVHVGPTAALDRLYAADGAFDAAADKQHAAHDVRKQAGQLYMATFSQQMWPTLNLRAGRIDAAIRLGLDLEA